MRTSASDARLRPLSTQISCPHCLGHKIKPLPPTHPEIQVRWYFCDGCGGMFSKPQTMAPPK